MHHVVLERWSRGRSALHSRDARFKLLAAFIFLLAVATTRPANLMAFAMYFALLIAGIIIARLPLHSVLVRSAAVLPFAIVFAAVSWFAGDASRAVALILRSYLSATSVLLLASTTPLPDLLRGLEWFRVPSMLVLITQFLYRYLFVLSEQAQHMRLAAQCRSGAGRTKAARRSRFQAAAGALSVLFARSYMRADGIHRAMMARGFSGHFPSVSPEPARSGDFIFLLASIAAPVIVKAAVR
jgi:cobalt/nickel transport system permease protein